MSSSSNPSSKGWEPPLPDELQQMLPQYEILGILGRGGMGAVYKAREPGLDRIVAIKLLPETFTKGDDELNYAARFRLEAQSMAKFSHPAIVSVFDFGETSQGQLYFVMEFVDGMDIQQYLKEHGGVLPQENALTIVAHVLDALEYAHNNGIVHRDIKPANILLNSEGQVKIADFGLAKALTAGDDEETGLTMTNMAVGTLDFIAPEAFDPDKTPDQRADLYAVGVMLYRMLTGKLPRGNFDFPSEMRVELDPRLDDVIEKAMYANPDSRYSSASDLRLALEPILTSPTTLMQIEAEEEESKVFIKSAQQAKSKKKRLIGTVIAALIIIGGAGFFLMNREKNDAVASESGKGILPLDSRAAVESASTGKPEKPKPSSTKADTVKKPAIQKKSELTSTKKSVVTFITATKDQPFVNSLGMRFVPVSITGGPSNGERVLFSIWETRVKDYEAFVKESRTIKWEQKNYQEADHPAMAVNWEDASAFCEWLTEKGRKEGKLGLNETYRLPTDHEWSCAVGIGEKEDALLTPNVKSGKIAGVYPWGEMWPPSKGAGNYYGEETKENPISFETDAKAIEGYDDGFDRTSPGGSFQANQSGLYDMGGNVWEWCDDWCSAKRENRVLRGSGWSSYGEFGQLSSYRHRLPPATRYDLGFRMVMSYVSGENSGLKSVSQVPDLSNASPQAKTPLPPQKSPDKTPEPKQSPLLTIPGFKKSLDEYLQTRNKQLGSLATKYMNRLDGDLNKAADSGNLNLVTVLQSEKAAVESLQKTLGAHATDPVAAVEKKIDLPPLAEGIPDDFSKLRELWTSENQRIHHDLALGLQRSLINLEGELAKAQDLDKVKALQDFRASLVKIEPSKASQDKPFENMLGMKFVPVPITGGPSDGKRILFSIWETRVKDYAAFIEEDNNRSWPEAGFKQEDDHPAAYVSWEDAVAFCEWLTKLDREKGKLGKDDRYRLPTDHEWSCAVGIENHEDAEVFPSAKHNRVTNAFPWGEKFPPPLGAGNYYGQETESNPVTYNPDQKKIENFDDGHDRTSPVGSFSVNEYGLYDLGGNLWEWCQEWLSSKEEKRTLRGGSWGNNRSYLLSSARTGDPPTGRHGNNGFRCVIGKDIPNPDLSGPKLATTSPPGIDQPSSPPPPDKTPEPKRSSLLTIPGFKKSLDDHLQTRNKQLGGLAVNYMKRLDGDLNKAADSGNLNLVTVLQKEKAAVENLQKTLGAHPTDPVAAVEKKIDLPPLAEGIPDVFKDLRTIWTNAKKKISDDLEPKFRQSLNDLEDNLRNSKNLVNAERVKVYRDAISGIGNVKSGTEGLVSATREKPFENSLGMKFVPVPITGGPSDGKRVLFGVWETRVKDYAAFIKEDSNRAWPEPDFKQGEDHPAAMATWDDSVAFCKWLTERDRKAGNIKEDDLYRLPTDHEWSCAVGIGESEDAELSPKAKQSKIRGVYLWGETWPIPEGAGNFAGEETEGNRFFSNRIPINGYDDGFAKTSPVGSFEANEYGLFDMGGNLWERCEDWYSSKHETRVLRGASCADVSQTRFLSSYRRNNKPSIRFGNYGFRVVLSSAPKMDDQGNSKAEKKNTPVKPLVTSPTTPPKNAITPSIPITNLQAFGFDALAKRPPTMLKEFEDETGDKFKNRGNVGGLFYVDASRGGGSASAWNQLPYDNGFIEVDARLAGNATAAWIVCFTGHSNGQNRGIQISVGDDGWVMCSSGMFDKAEKKMEPIKLHRLSSRKAKKFHTIGFLLSDNAVEVFFDGEQIGEKLNLDFDLTPGMMALGGSGAGRFEFERLSYWKADD